MERYTLQTLEASPASSESLAILDAAMRAAGDPPGRRARTCADSRSPDEGLALLDAYVTIADRDVRQAILDVVLTIAASHRG